MIQTAWPGSGGWPQIRRESQRLFQDWSLKASMTGRRLRLLYRCLLSDMASWSRQRGSGVPFPSLWSKQTHYCPPVMQKGSRQVPGLRTQPTAKLPWHRATFNGHMSIWRRERRYGEPGPLHFYLNCSREASGIGSFWLCLSSAPVVNQLGDQRRRWAECHKALPHTSAWAATSSTLTDSRPTGGQNSESGTSGDKLEQRGQP